MMAHIRNGAGGVVFVLLAFLFFAVPAWGQTVDKTSPSEVRLGETFTYRIEVARGTGTMRDDTPFLEDILPEGVTFVEFTKQTGAACTPPDQTRRFTCTITAFTNNNTSAVVEFDVVANERGAQTNVARILKEQNGAFIDADPATTIVETRRRDDRRDDRRDRFDDRFPPGFFDGFDNFDDIDDDDNDGIPDIFDEDVDDEDEDGDVDQEDEFLDAQNELDGEGTDGELTDDDGPAVSANAGEGVAEASTPNAVARAEDPDDLQPLRSTPDDVVDEIDTGELPLPNTGGMPLFYWLLPLAGLLMLAGLPVYRWIKNRG